MGDVKKDVLEAFGERLSAARDQAGLSQDALAQATRRVTGGDTQQATVSRWEAGKHPPTLREIAAMAQVLGVRVSDLVDEPPETEHVSALRDIYQRAGEALGVSGRAKPNRQKGLGRKASRRKRSDGKNRGAK